MPYLPICPKFTSWLIVLPVALLLTACPVVTEQATQAGSYDAPALMYEDHAYARNIRTVQLYRAPVEESFPVLYMNRPSEPLILEFDELMPLEQRESDFFVDIISCDKNWNPSGMVPIEFYDGFTQDRITDFQRSSFTKIPYVHYRYEFPQSDESFKLSGNYILKVYRDANPRNPVITRRFVVVDSRVRIASKYLLDGRVERQEFSDFNFEVSYGGLNVFNPATDLDVRVLQNFRWDNALNLGQPRFQQERALEYQVNINVDYRSGQEYRRLGLESVRLLSEALQDVEEREDAYELFLFPNKPRAQSRIESRRDRNGSYAVRVQEWNNFDTEADYVRAFFFFQTSQPLPEDQQLYVFGRMSNWRCLPEFRLGWNAELRRYETDILLKQGIYDYHYVVQTVGDPVPDERPMEGLRRQTENFYTILVYFRPPGARTDQLIGLQPLNYYE